jgi:hypothetical protein
LVVAVSLWLRTTELGKLPGINGDEAWFGVQVSQMVAGRPFALRTPSGLPVHPFFVALEAPLVALFPGSLWVLRAPAVVMGALAVLVVFVLTSRILDRTTALLATILLLSLPSAIGYSRLGAIAFPGETSLFSMLAVYFAIRGRGIATFLSYIACLLVHASNIFLLPVLLPLWVVSLWRGEARPAKRRQVVWITGAIVLIPIVTWMFLVPGSERLALLAERAEPANWVRFMQNYGRLITGVSLRHFVVGPLSPQADARCDGIFWTFVAVLLVFGLPRLVQGRQWHIVALIVGIVLGAMALYLAGGREALRPHHERYGFYLFLPTILAIATLLSSLLPNADSDGSTISRQASLAVVLLGPWVLFVSFRADYIDAIERAGGESHVSFRSAAIEPKQQALQLIIGDLSSGNLRRASKLSAAAAAGHHRNALNGEREHTWPVVAEDWWLYWPLRFVATRHPATTIISPEGDRFDPFDPRRPAPNWKPFMDALSGGGYAVAYADGALERLISSTFPARRRRQWTIQDYASRHFLTVFRIEPEQ